MREGSAHAALAAIKPDQPRPRPDQQSDEIESRSKYVFVKGALIPVFSKETERSGFQRLSLKSF